MPHPESHVPRFRARVDTGRPGFDSRSGCRGFNGLVPQPLCMKSKVCSEEQTCVANADRIVRGMSRAAYHRHSESGQGEANQFSAYSAISAVDLYVPDLSGCSLSAVLILVFLFMPLQP